MRKSFFATITAALLAFSSQSSVAQVTVTTGGGYVKMVQDLVTQYEKDTGNKVATAFGGNIGQMLAQVESGSPVTVVISDATSLKKFTKALNAQAEVTLGTSPLILAWRKGLTLKTPQDLTQKAIERIAMPDPKAAVYGRAAKEYLEQTGLSKQLSTKINVVSMVPQVLSYVSRGEMDAGFINLLAARQGKDKIGGFLPIEKGYTPITMTAQPVKGEKGQASDVKAFLNYLASPSVDAILQRHGVSRH